MKNTYEITVEDGRVSISCDGIWACDGRLDTVCLSRGEISIVDASAPLGEDVYSALEYALWDAMDAGKARARVTI